MNLQQALSVIDNPTLRDDIAHRLKSAPKPKTKKGRELRNKLAYALQTIPKSEWGHIQYYDLYSNIAYDLDLGEVETLSGEMTPDGKVKLPDGTLLQHPQQFTHKMQAQAECQPYRGIESYKQWSGIEAEITFPPADNISYVAGVDQDQYANQYGSEAAYNYMTIYNGGIENADAEAGIFTSAATYFRRGYYYLYTSINGKPKYFRDFLPDGGQAIQGSDGFKGSRTLWMRFNVAPGLTLTDPGDLRLNVIDYKTGFQKIYTTSNTPELNAGTLFDLGIDHGMARTTSLLVNSPGGYTKYNKWMNTKLVDWQNNAHLWTSGYTYLGPYNGDDRAYQCNLNNMTIESTMISPDYAEEVTVRIN